VMPEMHEWRFHVTMINQHGHVNDAYEAVFDYDPAFKIEEQEAEIERLRGIIARSLQQIDAIEHEMDGWTTAPGSLFDPVKHILKEGEQ